MIVGTIGVSEIMNFDEDKNTYIVVMSYFAYYLIVLFVMLGRVSNSVSSLS